MRLLNLRGAGSTTELAGRALSGLPSAPEKTEPTTVRTQSEDELQWEGPVTFDIAHNYTCSCHEGRPIEYGIAIKPKHISWKDVGVGPVLVIYSEELDELLKLIAQHLDPGKRVPEVQRRQGQRASNGSDRITFTINGNRSCRSLGEYSLQVVGRGIDDILPVNREDLADFVSLVSDLKQREKQSKIGCGDQGMWRQAKP